MRNSTGKAAAAWILIGGMAGAGSVAWAEGNRDKAAAGAATATAAGAKAEAGGPDAAALAKYAGPSDKHKLLASLAGSWDAHSKAFLRPGQPPQENHGTSENKLILGGRFLQEDYSNTFGKMPFQGHGLTGYDLAKQKYVNVWVDNLGSGLTLSEGSLDPSGKVLTFTGSMFDPHSGKDRPTKTVTRIESADRHVFEIYDIVDGKEVRIMEVVYTRRK
jgi:hypothetical protein